MDGVMSLAAQDHIRLQGDFPSSNTSLQVEKDQRHTGSVTLSAFATLNA